MVCKQENNMMNNGLQTGKQYDEQWLANRKQYDEQWLANRKTA